MMKVLEIISLYLIANLCVLCTKSDLRKGMIYNKTLVVFSILAVVIDAAYYGYFARDLLIEFLMNLIVVAVISLYLFYSHSFAGGDCKMFMVLAMLYPARFYITYGNSNITLFLTIGFSILAGYIYLLSSSVWGIATKKVKITSAYVRNFLLSFIKSYLIAMLYIALFNCLLVQCSSFGLNINGLIVSLLCMVVAWLVGKFPLLRKKIVFIPVAVLVALISVSFGFLPISLYPGDYVLVLILLFCQMTIKTIIYEEVSIDQIKKGTILSAFSSMLMQSSITKGLPGVSTEDLKSRLTESEAESVKIWARATHTKSLTIVKKIPFAIFISVGFLGYWILWSVLI